MLEPQSPHTAPHGLCEEEEQPPLEVEGSWGEGHGLVRSGWGLLSSGCGQLGLANIVRAAMCIHSTHMQ